MLAEVADRLYIRVAIKRPAGEAYEFLSQPENFPRWASGLAGALKPAGEDWLAETPQGRATVRFSERNSFGVLDHSVTLPQGRTIYVPLRLTPKGEGCELALTLYRRPEHTDESFAADAKWVRRDLEAAKRLLEAEIGL